MSTRFRGLVAANVFGVVWMYNQMRGRECFAEVEQISANSGFGTTATRTALRSLEGEGWVERLERPGKTTVYRDTGRWSLAIVGEETVSEPTPAAEAATPATPTRGVALTPKPQRDTLPTPTPDVAPPTRGVALPQRVALPNRQVKQTTKQTRQQDEEEKAPPVHTRPAPKPGPLPRQTPPSPSSVIDPDDGMAAALLEGCCLDPELTRPGVLISVADYAKRLKARKFTPDEVREAAATWAEFLGPNRDPDSIEPPRPQQLAEWAGIRRAAEAQRRAAGKGVSRATAPTHGLVPVIER